MLGEKAKRLQARGSLLGSSDASGAAIVAYDWKCTIMLCQHRGSNSDSPLLDVKQGRFQSVDVTNNLFARGSHLHLS